MASDPLLQPYRLKHLLFRNRLMSTAHEPAYTEDGLPKERYRLYHAEKAKGGIALTMIGGSSVVAPDSPQAFGNILLYKDEVVRWLNELADDVHGARRGGDDPDDASRPADQLEQGGLAAGHRALQRARADASRLSEGHGGLGHHAGDPRLRRRRRAGQSRRPRWPRARVLRPSDRPVLVARHQQARRRLWRIAREPHALRPRSPRRDARAGRRRLHRRRAHGLRRGLGARAHPRGGRLDRQAPRRLWPDRLRQRHPRPYRHRGGAFARHPRHGLAIGAAPRIRRRGPAAKLGFPPSTRRGSRTWRRRATPSSAASSIWSA